MEGPIDLKATLSHGFSRRKFLRDTGVGLPLVLGGMRVFARNPAALFANDSLYPIKIGPTRRYFVDQNNRPFLMQGDSAWSLLVAATKEEAEQYLENRRRKGFNTIIVNLIEHKFPGRTNRYGEGPFLVEGDFSTPNEKYFEHADWVIRKAGRKEYWFCSSPFFSDTKGLTKVG